MAVILPGVGRDFPPVFSWDWDGKTLKFVGVGRERFENSLPCHPLVYSRGFGTTARNSNLPFMFVTHLDGQKPQYPSLLTSSLVFFSILISLSWASFISISGKH